MTNLTKSKLISASQCDLRIWYQTHSPELASPVGTENTMMTGTFLGERARTLFPGGELVGSLNSTAAIAATEQALRDRRVHSIFEGAFQTDEVLVRADILDRTPNGWRLIEVKSGSKAKAHHVLDAAIQLYVLLAAGIAVNSVEIMHLDSRYVLDTPQIDWHGMFAFSDVTEDAHKLLGTIPDLIADAQNAVARGTWPSVEPGKHCSAPYACEFWDHCTRNKPGDWVFPMYYFKSGYAALHALGIERVGDVPDEFLGRQQQRIIRDAHRDGEDWISSDLAALLPTGETPWAFDIETVQPAIPIWTGTRPYQQIPFQWSAHRRKSDGSLEHREFLAAPNNDPRPEFIASVIEAFAQDDTSILVYSPFEATAFKTLISAYPDHANALTQIRNRFVDVAKIVRNGVYDRKFGGSYSIKSVGPALANDVDYSALEGVSHGLAASEAFQQMAMGQIANSQLAQLRSELLAYCELDTLALLKVFENLHLLSNGQKV